MHEALTNFITLQETQNEAVNIRRIRFSGLEFGGTKLKAFCNARGIAIEEAAPYTAEQNGGSERSIALIILRSRAMMIEGKMLQEHWPYAVKMACHILNRSATKSLNNMTPYQALSALLGEAKGIGKKPDVSNLRVFGCRAYIHIPKERRVQSQKFKPRAQIGKLVGYNGHHNYLIYVPERGDVIVSPHVSFDETLIDDWTQGVPEQEEEVFEYSFNPNPNPLDMLLEYQNQAVSPIIPDPQNPNGQTSPQRRIREPSSLQ